MHRDSFLLLNKGCPSFKSTTTRTVHTEVTEENKCHEREDNCENMVTFPPLVRLAQEICSLIHQEKKQKRFVSQTRQQF